MPDEWKPDPKTVAATRAWSEGVTRRVVGELRRRRNELGLHAEDVARRTHELGSYVSRGTIAKLESGERKQITLPEVLALTSALNLPTALAIAPLREPTTEVAPGVVIPSWAAFAMLTGEREPGDPLGGGEGLPRMMLTTYREFVRTQRRLQKLAMEEAVAEGEEREQVLKSIATTQQYAEKKRNELEVLFDLTVDSYGEVQD